MLIKTYLFCCIIELSVSHWVIEASSCYGEVSEHKNIKALYYRIIFKCLNHCCHWLIIQMWYITLVSMVNFISSECLVNDRYLHPLLVNFSHRQADYLSGCQRRALLITLSRRRFNKIFIFATGFLVSRPRHAATGAHLLLLHYIVVSNLEADILSIKSWFYFV